MYNYISNMLKSNCCFLLDMWKKGNGRNKMIQLQHEFHNGCLSFLVGDSWSYGSWFISHGYWYCYCQMMLNFYEIYCKIWEAILLSALAVEKKVIFLSFWFVWNFLFEYMWKGRKNQEKLFDIYKVYFSSVKGQMQINRVRKSFGTQSSTLLPSCLENQLPKSWILPSLEHQIWVIVSSI